MKYHSDILDICGFDREKITKLLAKKGVDISTTTKSIQSNSSTPEIKNLPEWATYCAPIKRFTVHQLVLMLCGYSPYYNQWLHDEDGPVYDAIKAAVQHAIDDGELTPTGKTNGDDTFAVDDLRAWVQTTGYCWPLPMVPTRQSTPAPAADSALLEKVQQLEAQNADLLQQVAALEHKLEQATVAAPSTDMLIQKLQDSEQQRVEFQHKVDRLQVLVKDSSNQMAKLTELTVAVGRLQAENTNAATEIKKLKSEIGSGKGLATWRKLAIGMAVGGYGYNAKSSRSDTSSRIAGDLASAGISIDADTVRNRLKEAAIEYLPTSTLKQTKP